MAAPKGNEYYKLATSTGREQELTKDFGDALAEEFLNWWYSNPDCVWFYQFFDDIKIMHRSAVDRLKKRSIKFKDALAITSKSQEGRIFQGGMKNLYKEGTTKLALTCKYKWKPPAQQNDVNVKNSNIKSWMEFADGQSADMMAPE